MSDPAVLVVGSGPTGLSAAAELRRQGVGPVLVVEREAEPGGIPRHTDHQGFGLQDLRRAMTGPSYARRLVARATGLGAEVRCSTTVTEIGSGVATLVSPAGIEVVRPKAVLLATGARERPRAARLIPGERGAGVLTTGQLQQRAMAGRPVGRRVVIVGAEHVAVSAAMLLRHHGATVVAMLTEEPTHQSIAGAALLSRWWLKAPLLTGTKLVEILGRRRVDGVIIEDRATRRQRRLDVDTVIVTGDWIPDNELARRSGLEMDPHTRGPLVDSRSRTSVAGLLAAGNLVHPAETAGTCALEGRRLARLAVGAFDLGLRPADGIRLEVTAPIAWAWPGLLDPSAPPAHVLFQLATTTTARRVVLRQGARVVARHRLRHGRAGRSLRLPGSVVTGIDHDGPPATLEVTP